MRTPRFPLLGKAVALLLVLFAVVVALDKVEAVVAERQGRLHEAEQSVAASLASAQTLVGPLATRSCTETWQVAEGDGKERRLVAQRSTSLLAVAPATLDVQAEAVLEPRRRGIFVVNGYVLKARIVAGWADVAGLVASPAHPGGQVACEAPRLMLALGDARGVRSAVVRVDGTALPVRPGSAHPAHRDGLHVDLDDGVASARRPMGAEIALELVGTASLDVAPVGESTRVALASDWPHPSFAGRFLPVERRVDETGFKARWALTSLATSAPRLAAAGAPACNAPAEPREAGRDATDAGRCVETFGVSFIDPVGVYALADRATKYGLLFVVLVFSGVAAVELGRGVRVHPIQYGLVGAGLVVFFLLMTSLSEHLPFAFAYAIAAAACTTLLGFYASFVLRGLRPGVAFGAAIGVGFGVLYGLLQLEQTALLLGSLLLFGVLAAVMVATRRIDWYATFDRLRARAEAPAPAAA